jgi:hypothetical protein
LNYKSTNSYSKYNFIYNSLLMISQWQLSTFSFHSLYLPRPFSFICIDQNTKHANNARIKTQINLFPLLYYYLIVDFIPLRLNLEQANDNECARANNKKKLIILIMTSNSSEGRWDKKTAQKKRTRRGTIFVKNCVSLFFFIDSFLSVWHRPCKFL